MPTPTHPCQLIVVHIIDGILRFLPRGEDDEPKSPVSATACPLLTLPSALLSW